jgi:hypothetical protein
MGFLAPWFLAGLAAIGIPVYVHLLRRHTTTPQPVSSLMFFEQGTQSSTRHRRLRHLLLFALRAALVLLLVLAFANPFIRRTDAGAKDKLLLVVVDNSFSMRAGSRFVDAKQGALRVLASKRSSQRAQVMALGGQLQVLTQPTQDSGALRTALEGIQPGDSHGNFGELGRGLRALAETVHTPMELHLFSDLQKTNMPVNFADMVLPANVTLVLHAAGKAAKPNWTVESIDAPAELADPKDLKRSRVEAVIAGYQTPAATRTVSLVVNGKTIATRKVEVPANGRATVEFQPLDVPYGFNRCELKIDATDSSDSLSADDRGVFVVRRSDLERVLFVHQASDSRSQLYFGAALAAAAQSSFILQSIGAEQSTDVDPTKYAFVVLSDTVTLPSIFENTLSRYVSNGGSVLVTTGTSAGRYARIPVFGETIEDAHYYSRDGGYAKVGHADLTHPAMKQATESGAGTEGSSATAKEEGGWSDLKIYYAASVDAAHSRVLVRLTDGTPLLLDKQVGEGHVLLLTSGLDNLTNDLPLHPIFVAFVDKAARYLSGSERLSGSRVVDSFVQLRTSAPQPNHQGMGVEIINPDGHRALSLSEASSIQSYQLTRAGFYSIRFANGKDVLIGVNPDRQESDLETIPDDVLQLWSGNSGTTTGQVDAVPRQADNGSNGVWWYIMLLVLATAVAESIVASQHLGTQREEA